MVTQSYSFDIFFAVLLDVCCIGSDNDGLSVKGDICSRLYKAD